VENGIIYRRGTPVLETKDILIPGVHNIENYCTAILAVEGLVSDDVIRRVAEEFGGVEHRLEFVRELDGVKYFNHYCSGTLPYPENYTAKVTQILKEYYCF
jgi:UDP-N-acetylmuramoylalanine--D-glutamate ligase